MTVHTLKTAHENAALIEQGQKDATVRYDYEDDIAVGDSLAIIDAQTGEQVAETVVNMADEMAVESVIGHLASMHRQYPHENTADLLRVLNKHYTAEITATTLVDVIGYAPIDDGDVVVLSGGGVDRGP